MDSQWLKMQFQTHPYKSKAALARSLKLEPPAISKILSGTRQIKAHEYIQMRKFFGLDRGDEYMSDDQDTYVIQPLQNLEEGAAPQGDWSIPASVMGQKTNAPPDKIKIFLIEDTIMEPEVKKGEYVVVDMSDTKPNPPGIFVISDGYGYMARFCTYKAKIKTEKIQISAAQEGFEPQTLKADEVDFIGRVIGKLEWL